jgi:hypothetical protein
MPVASVSARAQCHMRSQCYPSEIAMLPESVNSPNPFSETGSDDRAPFYDILAARPNVASRPCVA